MEPGAGNEVVIEGDVDRVTYESAENAFRVIKLSVEGRALPLAVVGSFPPVAPGARVRVRGVFAQDPRHGEQFRAETVTELAPSTLVGIERYLGSGLIKGVGGVYAKRIVATFGLDTLRILDEDPGRLGEVEGLGKRRVDAIVSAWQEQRSVREVMVFLQAHGASGALAARVFRRYGSRAVAVVSQDPYRLALDVWGIGFKTADRIAASLGVAKDSGDRIQAGLLQALHDATEDGHVFTNRADLVFEASLLLELDADGWEMRGAFERALEALAVGGHVVVEEPPALDVGGLVGGADGAGRDDREARMGPRIYAAAMHDAEARLAARLAGLATFEAPALRGVDEAVAGFEASAGVTLAAEQRDAVATAATSRVLVITGGPGVGKTTIVRAILSVLDGAGIEVRLAAPTGRAAKRMTEATGKEATTLHRLLEFDPKVGAFRRNRSKPVSAGALVVDEASMLNLPMADALADALADDARLVLVGDVDQLPSVGPGAVLRDLIASGVVPCVRLTQIFRQARESLIVTNAHRINSGEQPVLPPPGETSADFFVIERRDPEAAKATIVELVTNRIPKRFGFHPMRDVQVLAPMHKGAAGSLALNDALQAALNPEGDAVTRGARTFRVGDKVMQLRNDYERNVWNGDVGIIQRIDVEERNLVVGFDPRPGPSGSHGPMAYDREVTYEPQNLDELTLAYACSVHKSQGSEYPAVVIPFLANHFVMLTRNLLYTAVTRGRRLVVLVCDSRALSLALASDRNDERRAGLAARLRAAVTLG